MNIKSSPTRIAICMGSQSDWPTMREAADTLTQFGISHEAKIVSAHRTRRVLPVLPQMHTNRALA